MQYLDAVSKMTEWSVHFQGKPFNITVIQVYAPTSNAEEVEAEWFYEDPQEPSRTNTPKRCPFHYKRLECKSRESRDTWSNRQIWPWSTEWSRAKANNFAEENALVIENTLFQQYKRRLYTWTSPDGQHRKQIDYILCNRRWRSSIQSAKIRLGADCGSDHEILTAKFRFKLKKVRKSHKTIQVWPKSSPLQLYSGVRNRFKGWDLIDRVPEELWMEIHDILQEAVIKTTPRKRNAKR